MFFRGIGAGALSLLALLGCVQVELPAQKPAPQLKLDSADLQRAHLMLRQTYDDIKRNYYDPAFRGANLDTSFKQYDERLESSKSINETFRVIAAFTLSFHDSHTYFVPPTRTNRSTPGFFMQVIGDKCYVTRIRPGTDAASKLHAGDQVVALNGVQLNAANFHDMEYLLQTLSPAPSATLDLVNPAGEHRQEIVNATLRTGKQIHDLTGGGEGGDFWQLVRDGEEDEHLSRMRYDEIGDTFILRIPTFEIDPTVADKAIEKAMRSKHLVIDLRGNGGGYIETLKTLLGHFFDHEVKLGDRVMRKETKAETIKPRKPDFTGDVSVLIDRNSASASELFARVIQLEHRGEVFGDRSAGAVMEAHEFEESTGTDYKVYFGLSITSANILMGDGKSLENIGVTPDQLMVPNAQQIAGGRDPVLSNAVEMTGAKLDPTAAGKLFPYEWPSL